MRPNVQSLLSIKGRSVSQLRESLNLCLFYALFTGPLMTILSSSNSELAYVCLCHIELLLSKMPKLFDWEYRSFFSRYCEVKLASPPHVCNFTSAVKLM